MITSWKMCLALYDNLLTKTKADLIDFLQFLVVNYLICPNLRTFFYGKKISGILAYFTRMRSLRSTCKIAKFCNFEIIQANSEFLMDALKNDI